MSLGLAASIVLSPIEWTWKARIRISCPCGDLGPTWKTSSHHKINNHSMLVRSFGQYWSSFPAALAHNILTKPFQWLTHKIEIIYLSSVSGCLATIEAKWSAEYNRVLIATRNDMWLPVQKTEFQTPMGQVKALSCTVHLYCIARWRSKTDSQLSVVSQQIAL